MHLMDLSIKTSFALLFIGFIFLVGKLSMTAIAQTEVVECLKLERDSREITDSVFYLTEWQSEMCKSHGFTINARIQSS